MKSFLFFIVTVIIGTSVQAKDRPILPHQLWNDIVFLTNEPDFYLVVGGLGLGPSIFKTSFHNESPEFTELWGESIFADKLFESGEFIGDAAFPVTTSALSWSLGKVTGSEKMQAFGSDLIRTQAINGLLTIGMKKAVNRARPNGAAYSYPSGHTSSAFTTAGVVYRHFGKNWGIPAFGVAVYVGLSRLQENKHYLSDIIAGGILGSYVSLKLSNRSTAGKKLRLSPVLLGDGAGVAFSYGF